MDETKKGSRTGAHAVVVAGVGVLAAAVVLAAAAWSTPSFATLDNLSVIVRAASATGIVAVGMSYVTISGNLFALSSGQLAALLGIVYGLLVRSGHGALVSSASAMAVAIAAGAMQGFVINLIRNPIVTTIAFGAVFAGVAALVSGNGNVRVHDQIALLLGTARPLGVPIQSWVFVLWTLLGWWLMRKTRLGRVMTLTGSNRQTAVATGLRVDVATIAAMCMLALSASIVSIFSVSQFSEAKADMFSGLDIDCIASVLVGGVALRGGLGSPAQAAGGAILIAMLQNFMLLKSLPTGIRFTIVGALVVVASSAFHLLQRRSQ